MNANAHRTDDKTPEGAAPKRRSHLRLAELDEGLLRAVTRRRATPVTNFFRFLVRAHDPDVCVLWCGIFLVAGGIWQDIGAVAGPAMIIASVAAGIVKRLVRRARPKPEFHVLAPPDPFSFPSGHTAVAFALALSVMSVAPWLVPLLIMTAGLVAYARMYFGVHYPVDVLAGAVIGAFTGSVAALV